MRSGVRRARTRSFRFWRMISCAAAKQMRWVKPSITTVSPSRTWRATASFIVTTLDGILTVGILVPSAGGEVSGTPAREVPDGLGECRGGAGIPDEDALQIRSRRVGPTDGVHDESVVGRPSGRGVRCRPAGRHRNRQRILAIAIDELDLGA